MSRTRVLPCLVRDPSGSTVVKLNRGLHSVYGYPKWECDKWECPKRGELTNNVYEPLSVRLGDSGQIHGVVRCEGGGKVERR